MTDPRQFAPATQRNRDPILEVLRRTLPASGLVLEVASGSGEHVVHFAKHLPHLTFQPSDRDPAGRASVSAWVEDTGVRNVRPPIALNAAAPDWPITAADAVLCINMAHISPWAATRGLIAGAAAILGIGAPLYLYGPYLRAGVATAPSNEIFDQSLRARNPEWGLRRLEEVAVIAAAEGFSDPEIVEMPANNLSLVFRRTVARTT